jgi:hypothetical protein
MRLGTRRESRDLLVPDMDPFDLALGRSKSVSPFKLSPTMP